MNESIFVFVMNIWSLPERIAQRFLISRGWDKVVYRDI